MKKRERKKRIPLLMTTRMMWWFSHCRISILLVSWMFSEWLSCSERGPGVFCMQIHFSLQKIGFDHSVCPVLFFNFIIVAWINLFLFVWVEWGDSRFNSAEQRRNLYVRICAWPSIPLSTRNQTKPTRRGLKKWRREKEKSFWLEKASKVTAAIISRCGIWNYFTFSFWEKIDKFWMWFKRIHKRFFFQIDLPFPSRQWNPIGILEKKWKFV